MTSVSAFDTFRRLHENGVLRLANAWDAGSARLIENLGAPAIATTSAGVAWSNGYADGDRLPVACLLKTVANVLRVIQVPLTVDIEGGYSDDPAVVADLVMRLAGIGVAGINLEDGSQPPERLCAKIERIQHECTRHGTRVFINARTDIYLRNLVPMQSRVAQTLARAAMYRQAGADGLFVPGLADRDDIAAIVPLANLPLNLLLRPQLPDVAELAALGVRRLSAGSDIPECVHGLTRTLAQRFLQDGHLDRSGAMDYAELNVLFAEA